MKNGSLGRIESVSVARMTVMLDDGRAVAFDLKDYNQLDHGYAATIHKAQGMTVDRAHVLATPGLDRHAAYVALSRHRDGVSLHYGRDDFADRDRLITTMSRERGKDLVADYAQPQVDPLPDAVARHGRIVQAMRFSHSVGHRYTPEQREELAASRAALDAIRPNGTHDLEAAMAGDPRLVDEAAKGRTSVAIRAMQLESEMRADPQLRADTFVRRWQALERQRRMTMGYDRETIEKRMTGMAKGLERDPQVESILSNRKAQLGLPETTGRRVGQSLCALIGRSRVRGIGF